MQHSYVFKRNAIEIFYQDINLNPFGSAKIYTFRRK